jgi:hypothetical protein
MPNCLPTSHAHAACISMTRRYPVCSLRWKGPLALISVIWLYGNVAAAQDIERARQLFDEASTLRESGHYADAIVRLRLAIDIKDTPGLEYHAGFCETKLGHYATAIEHYERAAVLIRGGASASDVATLLDRAHKTALEHVSHLRILLTKPVPGARLRIDDGTQRPLTEHDLLLDPGSHQVRVDASGYAIETRRIDMHDAEQLQIELSLSRVSQDTSYAANLQTQASVWKTASIGTAIGVTALGLATGIGAAVGHHHAHVTEQAALVDPSANPAKLAAARHDQQTYTTWETVGFVSAGIGAAATVALWSLWPSTEGTTAITAISKRDGTMSAGLAITSTF